MMIIKGKLTGNPEMTDLRNENLGKGCRYTLEFDREDDKDKRTVKERVSCVVAGASAEVAMEKLRKGMCVAVAGHMIENGSVKELVVAEQGVIVGDRIMFLSEELY